MGTVIESGYTRNPSHTTIACLSGLGIQDLLAVNQFWADL